MSAPDAYGGFEALDDDTCLALLSSAQVGRAAWSQLVDGVAEVTVLPVNFLVHHADVFFFTASGRKLAAVVAGRRLSFEVDDIEPAMAVGWSVVATGYAVEVTDPAERRSLGDLFQPWDRTSKAHLVRLRISSLTGRRIRPRPPAVREVRIGQRNRQGSVT